MKIFFLILLSMSATRSHADIVTPGAIQQIAARQIFLYERNGKPAGFPNKDKVFHCGVSCVLCKEYGPSQAVAVGVLKEVADVLGAGDPSWENLSANIIGVIHGTKLGVGDVVDEACATYCQDHFIPN